MRRPAVRLLLTLALSACVVGSVPATADAGIIPWAYDTIFGPVGSIHARQVGYYGGGVYGAGYAGGYDSGCGTCSTGCGTGGCYYGPAPRLFGGLRARRFAFAGYGGVGLGCGSCSTGCGCALPSCGTCNPCGAGGCGTGGCGIDGGYGMQSYGGGCATGQCNVNYAPLTNNSGTSTASPVTPANPPPVTGDAGTGAKSNGPTSYDSQGTPMGRSGTSDGYQAPAPGEGFRPRGTQEAAPTGGDPAADQFVPPKVNNTNKPAPEVDPGANAPAKGTNADPAADVGTDPATPPVAPKPKAPKRNFGDEEEEKKGGTSVGPRLELQEKITWHRDIYRSRQNLSAIRVSATVNRSALFPKMAWKVTSDAELAKK